MAKEAIPHSKEPADAVAAKPTELSALHPLGGHTTPKGDGGAKIIPAHKAHLKGTARGTCCEVSHVTGDKRKQQHLERARP